MLWHEIVRSKPSTKKILFKRWNAWEKRWRRGENAGKEDEDHHVMIISWKQGRSSERVRLLQKLSFWKSYIRQALCIPPKQRTIAARSLRRELRHQKLAQAMIGIYRSNIREPQWRECSSRHVRSEACRECRDSWAKLMFDGYCKFLLHGRGDR